MSKPTLEQYLAEVKERCEKATKGPWVWRPCADDQIQLEGNIEYRDMAPVLVLERRCPSCNKDGRPCLDPRPVDKELVAHSRTDVEVLLGMVEMLVGRLTVTDHNDQTQTWVGGLVLAGQLESLIPAAEVKP